MHETILVRPPNNAAGGGHAVYSCMRTYRIKLWTILMQHRVESLERTHTSGPVLHIQFWASHIMLWYSAEVVQ